jgi:hypothetical protein
MHVKFESNPNFDKNYEKTLATDLVACIFCGKGVKQDNWVHVHEGWGVVVDESYEGDPSADMGFYKIGPDCLKQHPEIAPFARTGVA